MSAVLAVTADGRAAAVWHLETAAALLIASDGDDRRAAEHAQVALLYLVGSDDAEDAAGRLLDADEALADYVGCGGR